MPEDICIFNYNVTLFFPGKATLLKGSAQLWQRGGEEA